METEAVDGFPKKAKNNHISSAVPRWIILMLILWCSSMVYAFWYFLLMDTRLFYGPEQVRLVEFEKSTLSKQLQGYLFSNGYLDPSRPQSYQGYIFHFFNGQCSCDKANQAHVQKLIKKYTRLGFMFLLVPQVQAQTGLSKEQLLEPWQQAIKAQPQRVVMLAQNDLSQLPIPASPSAAVLNGQGKLSYFGPYALGGVCKADENGLIETVLNSMVAGMEPDHPFVGGFGCFCQWKP